MRNQEAAYLIRYVIRACNESLTKYRIPHSPAYEHLLHCLNNLAYTIQFHSREISPFLTEHRAQIINTTPLLGDSTLGVTPVGAGEQRSADTGAPGA